jgi:flagellar motor switch protein FliG
MSVKEHKSMSGLEKASALLMALGSNASAEVFKHLNESEIESLSAGIIGMRQLDQSVMQSVVSEFERSCGPGAGSGRNFAAELLDQQLQREPGAVPIAKVFPPEPEHPFRFLYGLRLSRAVELFRDESPQIIASVLICLTPEKAATILAGLDEQTQSEVALRICSTGQVEPGIIKAIEAGMRSKLAEPTSKSVASGGPRTLAEILNSARPSTEQIVMGAFERANVSLGEQVRGMMFTFEDLHKLGDNSMRSLLKAIEIDDLKLAMRGAEDHVLQRFSDNMSEYAAEIVKNELAASNPVKVRDIEAAQNRITITARRLLAGGEISLDSDEEDMVA